MGSLNSTPFKKNASPIGCPPILLKNLSFKYQKNLILAGLEGEFPASSLTAIAGPNGGGKTTLLKLLGRMMPPSKGHIDYHGLTRKNLAYLPQKADMDTGFPLTVRELVSFGLYTRKGFFSAYTTREKELIDHALEEVGMADYAAASLNILSGGQFQRVLLARLVLQDASLILLDEPFAAVDPHTLEDLMTIIQGWHQQGRTIVVVSHDLDLVRTYFPQTLLLARQCLGWGKTEDVLTLENLKQAKGLSRDWERAPLELETPHLSKIVD